MPRTSEHELVLAGLLRRAGSEVESTIRGCSMGVTLPSETRIRITCTTGTHYAEGAVVAFLAGGTLVGHRVVGTIRDLRGRVALLTRGDAELFCDPPIDPVVVLGEVISREADSQWQAVPTPPSRDIVSRTIAAVGLTTVRILTRLDRDVASRLIEASIVALRRVRHVGRRLARTPG